MKYLSCLITLVLYFSPSANAEMMNQWNLAINYQHFKGDPRVISYIVGAYNAVTTVQAKLKVRGQSKLYCPPRTLTLNIDNLTSIIEEEMPKVRDRVGDKFSFVTLDKILIDGLISTFPCK